MESLGKLILRVSIAGLMLFHGVHKLLHGIGGVKYLLGKAGFPEVLSYGVYMGEIIAPLLLLIGVYTRVSALLIAATMLISIPAAFPNGFMATDQYGAWVIEVNALYFLGALAISLLGPGKYRLGNQRGFWKE